MIASHQGRLTGADRSSTTTKPPTAATYPTDRSISDRIRAKISAAPNMV